MPRMLGLDVLEDGLGEAAVPSAGVRQPGLGAGLARYQHRRGAALKQRQHLYQQQYFNSLTQIEAMQPYLAGVASTAATPTPAAAPLLHPGDGEAQPLQVAQPVPGPGPSNGLGYTPRLLQG